METSFRNCPTCNTDNSIKIETSPVTQKGFTTIIHKCTECNTLHTIDDEYKLIKYPQDAKETPQK